MSIARQEGARFASPGSVEHTKHVAKVAWAATKSGDHARAKEAHDEAADAFRTAAQKTGDPILRRAYEQRAGAHDRKASEHAKKATPSGPKAEGTSGLARWARAASLGTR